MYHCYSLIMNGRPCFLLSNIYIIYRYRYITCRKQPYICYLTWRFRDRFNRRNEQQVDLHHLSGGLHRPRAASHSFQRSVLRPLDRIIFDLDRIRHVVQKPCFWFTLTLLFFIMLILNTSPYWAPVGFNKHQNDVVFLGISFLFIMRSFLFQVGVPLTNVYFWIPLEQGTY